MVARRAAQVGYSTGDVSRLLDLSPDRIRAFVRAGFLRPRRGPRNEYRFGFQDLILLRTARGLLEARVSPRRVHAVLKRLARELPVTGALSGLRISVQHDAIVVSDGQERWDAESGQTLFDFEVAELARNVAPIARYRAERGRSQPGLMSGEDWFELGCELEGSSREEALEAYQRALSCDPEHAAAHLNLGRLRHEQGKLPEAEQHYRKALSLRGGDATAAFNLGVVLEDAGRVLEAISAYKRALELEPSNADAHFNVAGLYERLARPTAALRHLKAYRRLTRQA